MSPEQQTHLMELATASIIMPELPLLNIVRLADEPDAPAQVAALTAAMMQSSNPITTVTNGKDAVVAWETTLKNEYDRADRHRAATDPFSIDATNETTFLLAPVYGWSVFFMTFAVFLGVSVLINMISATITSSGEVAALTNSPFRAALFGTLPVLGMLIIHFSHYSARRDTTKRVILYALSLFSIACLAIWILMFVHAFPLDGMPVAVDDNLFSTAGSERQGGFNPLRWLIAVQFFGEVAAGGLVGIALEHFMTRGKKVIVTSSPVYEELDGSQRDITQDRVKAARLRGALEDYHRRYEASQSIFVQQGFAFLMQVQNELATTRSAAFGSLIHKYTSPLQSEGNDHA